MAKRKAKKVAGGRNKPAMKFKPVLATLGYVFSPDGSRVLMIHRNARPDDAHHGKWNGLGGKLAADAARVGALRDRLENGILSRVSGTQVNGDRTARVANTSNISFDRVEAESLLIALDLEGIAVSTGSACSSGTLEPSHVLKAMGLPVHRTQNSLRFSLGAFSTEAEVDRVVEVLPRLVEKLRGLTRKPQSVGEQLAK